MKICAHPTLYLYWLSMLILSSWKTCIGAAAALFIHELGHYIVCCLTHESIERLELTPFGGVMIYQQGKSPHKGWRGFCIAAAGPAANYFFLAYISVNQLDIDLIRSVASSSAAMLLINMLPALPLDGGRMIFSLGYYVFPLTDLVGFLTYMGIGVGISFLILSVYGFAVHGILNCSVLIVGGYLIYSAWQSRKQLLLENLFAVIQESEENRPTIQEIKTYLVPADTLLIQLFPYLERNNVCEFVFETEKKNYQLSEKMLCRLLLDQPLISIKDAYLKNETDRENSTFFP